MRTLSSRLQQHAGSQVTVAGWLHKKRKLGGLNFILLRDRAGVTQVLVKDEDEMEKLRGLQTGTVLEVTARAEADDRAPGGIELKEPELKVLVSVTEEPPIEIDKPIDHTPNNLDTLFEHRALNLRNLQEQKIFRVRSSLGRFLREFLNEEEFVEIQTPKLVAGAAEGGAEVFKTDYYGQEATLAQSPQLYKQMMVGVYERVYEIGPAFRAELSATTRHISEVTMLDIEMGFIKDHSEILELTERLLFNVLTRVYEEHGEDLKDLQAPELVLKGEFPRFTVAEVHELYSQETGEKTVGEKDLRPDEERWICDYAREKHGCEAVFITEFPIEGMKFYHMVNPENPKTALWADLLFRGLELATVPQREHRYDVLVEQMKAAGIDPEHPGFKYYLQAFRYGLPPHGGFGFGIDRLVQKTIGLNNIKEATLFPRDMQRLTP